MSVVVIQEGREFQPHGRKRIDIWWRGMKNGGLMVILAHLMTRNWEWANTEIRLLRLIENEAGRDSTKQDLEQLRIEARLEASVTVIVSDRPFPEIFRSHSHDADCIFMGFEVPPLGREASWYQQYQNMILEKPATILVSSVGDEDLTA